MHTHQEPDAPRRNLETALALAAAGIRIFPAICVANNGDGFSKRPLVGKWQKVATTATDQLVRWWRQWPHAVPGIPLKGHVVIDADRHGGADGVVALERLAAGHGGLPPGPVTETAGGGVHHVFKQPARITLGNRRGALPEGIDVRGVGGWIVAPGSVRPDGKVWTPQPNTPLLGEAHRAGTIPEIPAWLVAMIGASPRKPAANGAAFTPAARDLGPWAQRTLALVCDGMRRAPVGDRNETLNKAAFRLGSIVARGWIERHQAVDELSAAALASGLPPDEVQRSLASGFRAGLKSPAANPEDRPRDGLHLNGKAPVSGRSAARQPDKPPARLISMRASELPMRPIRWGWPGRIAMGKSAMFAGEPGVGKSTLLLDIAARFSVGGEWPCGEGCAPLGSVIILSAEDDPADTIAPRYRAAGGDLDKLHIIRAVQDGDAKRAFSLQADMGQLEAKIGELGDVACVVIDPVSSYLGKVDSHKNSEVRGVIDPLTEMASSTGAAFLLNTHFPKTAPGNKVKAIYRFVGSIAFVGAARTGFAVVKDPDDDSRRLVLPVKSNVGAMPSGLAYTLEQAVAGYYEAEPIYGSRVVWDSEPVSITADQAIAAGETDTKDERQAPERSEAETFLRSWLADGPKPGKDITRAAKDAGISEKTLRRARERICDTAPQRSDDGKVITAFLWRLKPSCIVTIRGDE